MLLDLHETFHFFLCAIDSFLYDFFEGSLVFNTIEVYEPVELFEFADSFNAILYFSDLGGKICYRHGITFWFFLSLGAVYDCPHEFFRVHECFVL